MLPATNEAGTLPLSSSFRDPAGRLFSLDGRLLRVVPPAGRPNLDALLNSPAAQRLMQQGSIVRTTVLDEPQSREWVRRLGLGEMDAAVVEHERIPFPSYPYEWPPEMLHSAALLTLELARALLPEGLGLKDATPYNVLFRGAQPVFIDALSLEPRDAGDPIWLPYAQFVRTFLLPLLVNRRFGVPLSELLTTRRDGLEPEEVYRLLGPLARFRPPFLSLVSIPTWLGARHKADDTSVYRKQTLADQEKARFILESLLKRLRRQLPEPAARVSDWTAYYQTSNYSEEQFTAKQEFVQAALKEFAPRRLLDAGCNTGVFSLMAARQGASVVAIDLDPAVIGNLWRAAGRESLDVLPLVVNLARPSPSLGWRYQECASFLDRARGGFDAVLMLALVHHLLVSERVPLEEIIALAAELTTSLLVIEYVGREDPMFRRICRGREHLHADFTQEVFEQACRARFDLVRSRPLGGTRALYLLCRKAG